MGYETKVLDILERNNVKNSWFENSCLFVEHDPDQVLQILADSGELYSYPAVLKVDYANG